MRSCRQNLGATQAPVLFWGDTTTGGLNKYSFLSELTLHQQEKARSSDGSGQTALS